MAIIRTDDKHYKAIADSLRNFYENDNTYTPGELPGAVAQGLDDAYTAGKLEGGDGAGYEQGVIQGEKNAYDAFWDDFQQNGQRTVYNSAFGGQWTANTFKPKYPLRPTNIYMMFFSNTADTIKIPDFVEFCRENNVVLDLSNAVGNGNYALAALHTNHFGVLDFSCSSDTSKTLSLPYLFYSHGNADGVKVIDEFICSERTVFNVNTLQHATQLEEVTFTGEIASDNFNVSTCTKLTHDSLMSIINTLKDYSSTTTTKTCTLGATNLAKLTDAEKAIATQKGWTLA